MYKIAEFLTAEQRQAAAKADYELRATGQPRTARETCALGEAFYDTWAKQWGYDMDSPYIPWSIGEPDSVHVAEIIRDLGQGRDASMLDLSRYAGDFIRDFDRGTLLGEALEEALGVERER